VFLYRLVEEGADRSYGVQVARLAGIPGHVVERARQVMARLEGRPEPIEPEGDEEPARALREIEPPYPAARAGEPLLIPADDEAPPMRDEATWLVLRQLFGLDIANLTPLQALLVLNELQQHLRGQAPSSSSGQV
jgi:DNA mismatch repair protein MutS